MNINFFQTDNMPDTSEQFGGCQMDFKFMDSLKSLRITEKSVVLLTKNMDIAGIYYN